MKQALSPTLFQPSTLQAACLTFRLCWHSFAIVLAEVQEVLPFPALRELPNSPPFVAGFATLGDRLVPVLDLARLLDLALTEASIDQHLIRLRASPMRPEQLWLVDRVLDLIPLPELRPLPPGHVFNDWVKGLIDDSTYLIDPGRLLLQEERQRLQALQRIANQRLHALDQSS